MERITLVKSDDKGMFYNVSTEGMWAEMNFVTTNKDVVRGGHYHKWNVELFFMLSGMVRVEEENVKTGERRTYNAVAMEKFVIQPYWRHTVTAMENSTWVSLNSLKFDPANPDMHKEYDPKTEAFASGAGVTRPKGVLRPRRKK
jgi:dTDP-4-dehydrorhamnose 3,5-epimerase-like enzyme